MNARQTLQDILTADEARLQQFIARHQPLLRELGDSWQRFLQDSTAAAAENSLPQTEREPGDNPALTDSPETESTEIPAAPDTSTPPPSDTAFSDNEAETAAIPPAPASETPQPQTAAENTTEPPTDSPEPAMPIPPHTPTPAPQPQPRISLSPLPPANEGQPYERKLPPDAPVLNIAFAQDCGLAWDGDARRIHGTPTTSGDIMLTITISHDGKPHDITQPLHINPDPKSLWKDLPSDPDAPFAKPDSAEDLQDTVLGRLLAARVRGRSHAHVGSYCDDDYRLASHDASGVHLIIVADGAGSASHARYGSQLAVNAAADTILALLDDPGKPHHKLAHADSATRKQIADNIHGGKKR